MNKPNGPRPAFLAFVTGDEALATARAHAAKNGGNDNSVQKGDITTACEYLKTNASPRILLIEVPNAKDAPAQFDKLADVCEPGTNVIATGDINEYSFYTWLLDIGISHYLLKPLSAGALEAAIAKINAPVTPVIASAPAPAGKVIAVIGTRGGVGATTLCTNLAGVIASDLERSTVLVDLDPQQGTVAMALDLDPGRGLRDALEKPDRIDGLFLERVMTRHSDTLHVLSTEEALDDAVSYSDQAASMLLKETRKKFTYTVVDLPRTLHSLTREMLKQADHVVLVTELTLHGLRDALRMMDFFRDTLKIQPPTIVANRIGLVPKHETPRGEFEKGLKAKLAAVVPFEHEVYAATSAGELLADKHKNSATHKILHALALQLIPDAASNNDEKPAKKFSLFSKGKK